MTKALRANRTLRPDGPQPGEAIYRLRTTGRHVLEAMTGRVPDDEKLRQWTTDGAWASCSTRVVLVCQWEGDDPYVSDESLERWWSRLTQLREAERTPREKPDRRSLILSRTRSGRSRNP